MTWLRRYRIRHYVENSLWILPLVGIVAALASARFLHWLEVAIGWESDFDPDTARTVLGTMASSMFTFIVFVCSGLLVAMQLASAQLTPRIIAIAFKNPVTKLSLTVFVFTFTFTLVALVRIGTSVHLLTASIAAYSSLACLGFFLYLMDYVGKWLRPSGALRSVAHVGRHVIESVYPRLLAESQHASPGPADMPGGEPTATIASPRDGVVLAFDIEGLVSLAQRAERVMLLRQELNLLHRTAERLFAEPEDRALADVSDFQGVGGKHRNSETSGQEQPATPP